MRAGALASSSGKSRFVSRKYERWFRAKVISIPSALSCRFRKIPPALLTSTSKCGPRLSNLIGEPADVCLRRKVRHQPLDRRRSGLRPDLVRGPRAPLARAPDQDHAGALACELARRDQADSRRRAGDQADLVFHGALSQRTRCGSRPVAVDRFDRECRQTHRDVLRTGGPGVL